jgi:MFS family permease
VQGIGAVAGGLASSNVVKRLGEVATCLLGLVLLVIGILVMAGTHSFVVVCVSAAAFGAALPMIIVSLMTLIQRRTPQAIMGRVSAAVEVVFATPQAISLALGSLLVVVLSYRQIFVIIAVVTAAAAVYLAVFLRDQILEDVRRPVAQAGVGVSEATVEAAVEAATPPATRSSGDPARATAVTPGARMSS